MEDGSELGRRYVADFAHVEGFYAGDYRRPEHLASHANKLLSRTWASRFDRDALADLLQTYSGSHGAPAQVVQNIEKLRDRHTVCILTGQQAGLGGGPLLTLYKAVTAIKLARDLEDAAGLTVVPVFWNASDDSDLEEVNRLRSVNAEGELRKFRFRMSAGKRPVRDILLPGADDPQWAEAAATLEGLPFADHARGLLSEAAGRDFGAGLTRLLYRLLGDNGLVVAEPRALTAHPHWRRVLAFELDNREQNRQQLQRLSERLDAMALPAGVPIANHLNLFMTVAGERRRITAEGRKLVVEGSTRTTSKTSLLKALKEDPASFTPNVILRPLVQNAIFPTVAYVGGPAEIAYHGLLKGLHRGAQVFMPLLFPRMSMTLVRQSDARSFDALVSFRRGLKWRQKEAIIVAEGAQAGLKGAFASLRNDLKGLARGLEPELGRLEQRTSRAVADVMNRVKHDPLRGMPGAENFAGMMNRYFPEDRPQERVISVVSALAEYGPELVEKVRAHPDVFDFHHHVALVDG